MVDEGQKTLGPGDKKGRWIEVELPKDENVIDLEVGGEFIGKFLETKPSEVFEGDFYHNFETLDGSIKKMYGKANLDRWLSGIKPGTMVKIKRFDDKKVGQPKAMQRFKVWAWQEE